MNPKLPAPVPPLDLSRVKALLFDVDGTLSDSDDQLIQRLVNLPETCPLYHSRAKSTPALAAASDDAA